MKHVESKARKTLELSMKEAWKNHDESDRTGVFTGQQHQEGTDSPGSHETTRYFYPRRQQQERAVDQIFFATSRKLETESLVACVETI